MYLLIRGEFLNQIKCKKTETIGEIKAEIAEAKNIDINSVQLNLNGAPLLDEQTVEMFEGLEIELDIGLVGGKVHGSLSRAGKVKGQTPRVQKKEKRKQKTGRAKRRLQYNRRFVNVVSTFGRRRGPNANS